MSNESVKEISAFNTEMEEYVNDLLVKGANALASSVKGSNLRIGINGIDSTIFLRVDDLKLITIGALLIPNVFNYLLNILPQMLYPFVVAYLQNLSELRDEDPVVINELYDYILENYGHFFDSTETQN